MTKEMIDAVSDCLINDHFVNGKSVKEFEDNFAKYIGTKYAVALNSGTAALFLALLSLGIKKGDIVVTQSATFVATANAIIQSGAIPLFVDVDSDNLEFDKDQFHVALKKYRSKIKAVIPVHLYGRTQDLGDILDVLSEGNIPVIEDACQAHGSELNGKKAGSIGKVGAFSFYSSKNMTVGGDGGMITTNDPEIRDKALSLRNQGASKEDRYRNDVIGYNFRLNSVNAAIGKIQLKYLDEWNKKRSTIAKFYNDELSGYPEFVLPNSDTVINRSSWHIYSLRTDKRERLIQYLNRNGIETGIHYPIPVHLQIAYKSVFSILPFKMNNTEEWAKKNLSLPIYGTMDSESANEVVSKIGAYVRENR